MTTAPVPAAFTGDPWDPGYGLAFGEEMDGGALEESTAELNLDLELAAAQWRPLTPDLLQTRPHRCPARCYSSTASGVSTRASGSTAAPPSPPPASPHPSRPGWSAATEPPASPT